VDDQTMIKQQIFSFAALAAIISESVTFFFVGLSHTVKISV
jgi:hypothetical protein